ncbi:BQ2448_5877 [Microbotryum intermedium]|uniref:BQ2448_5877 protein n=1 Tax=Microbotryum intermedium TaxID=269621 RepID=A0A238F5J9_9BASI|nr:BQ2448_5877 [Microbotryum intermedium]
MHSQHLAQQNRAAQHRIRELEDLLAIQQRLTSDTQASLHLAESRLESTTHSLTLAQTELSTLRTELSKTPTTSLDLFFRYKQLQGLWEQARDTLSCPICFDFIGKGQVVSLLCGHTFCQSCWCEWEDKHLIEFKRSSQQGRYLGPDCPECRESGVRHGKVRIWALEEVIRLVERGTKETEKPYTEKEMEALLGEQQASSPQHDSSPSPPMKDSPRPIKTSEEAMHREPTSTVDEEPGMEETEPVAVSIDAGGEESSWTLVSDELSPSAKEESAPLDVRDRTPAGDGSSRHSTPIPGHGDVASSPSHSSDHESSNVVPEAVDVEGDMEAPEAMELDEECSSILRPRQPRPWGPIVMQ